jgi:hypothetical protein
MNTRQLIEQCAIMLPMLAWEPDEAERATKRPTCAGYAFDGALRVAVWVTADHRFGAEVATTHEHKDARGAESYANTSGDGTGDTPAKAYAEAQRAYARACAVVRPAAPEIPA